MAAKMFIKELYTYHGAIFVPKLTKMPRLNSPKFFHTTETKLAQDEGAERTSKEQKNSSNELETVEQNFSLEKIFPEYYYEGKFISRSTYVEFIDMAMEKMDDLGLNKNLQVYKELFKVFPEGMYHPRSRWDKISIFNPVQQTCGVRVLWKMELNGVRPDKEMEDLVDKAFSRHSQVWLKLVRMNFWFMKGRNIDPELMPEVLPEKNHELAKIAMKRMCVDLNSSITVKNTSSLPDVIDKTWIVSLQSPLQQTIIEELNEKTVLRVEEGGNLWVGDSYLNYYVLKAYNILPTNPRLASLGKKPPVTHNFNKLKFMFYGKPIKEKLEEMKSLHTIDNYTVLACGITGTSSSDSLSSWLKLLQISNPKLEKMTVFYDIDKQKYRKLDDGDENSSDQETRY